MTELDLSNGFGETECCLATTLWPLLISFQRLPQQTASLFLMLIHFSLLSLLVGGTKVNNVTFFGVTDPKTVEMNQCGVTIVSQQSHNTV